MAEADDFGLCRSCGRLDVEPEYELPLCADCREELSRTPFPTWINVTAALVAIVLLIALFRFPASVQAGIAFERGRRAEKAGNYPAAAGEYQKVVSRFPDSAEALARLGIAHYRAGNVREAARILDQVGGREAPDEDLAAEVNRVIEEMSGPAPGK